ncbi:MULTISPECIES: acyl carrier protein [unclassified Streptomyces]|uniref:acyl carrier protein n=1 Tax=unclassified Streptomyces TaxID=2593676 RepID=UPI002E29B134|nr:acyl carrier protein [Streptomyces sp. NBC_00223]
MAVLDINGLRRILVACAGQDDGVDLSGDFTDTSFTALGYDSLALIETSAVMQRELGIVLSDEEVALAQTPGALLDLVNSTVAATG